MDKLYESHPRLAAHLSAFGENVALGESLRWLSNLQLWHLLERGDGDEHDIIEAIHSFIDDTGLLPHGARTAGVSSGRIEMLDGGGVQVAIEEMSDGYRSILSLTPRADPPHVHSIRFPKRRWMRSTPPQGRFRFPA